LLNNHRRWKAWWISSLGIRKWDLKSSSSFLLSVFQPGEELLPKDANGKIILDNLHDTWEVCAAADSNATTLCVNAGGTGWGAERKGFCSGNCLT
jgi:hypothetical protein